MSTAKMEGSEDRSEPGGQVFSVLPRSVSASEPESEAARPNFWKKVFRKLNRLFRR